MQEYTNLRDIVTAASQDKELHTALVTEISRARAMTGRSFDDVRIGAIGEMGDAAGTCQMGSGEIKVREDIVGTAEAVREKLAHVLVHEAEHANGNGSEGLTELHASLKVGRPPVDAYREKVRSAEQLTRVVGLEEARESIKRGEVVLLQVYVRERLKRDVAAARNVQEIIEEGKQLIKAAA